ncbi:MAG: hypothetical protein HYW65_02695 [Candidatus Liptonbacteria bacterium]|nr:hypothetical protein [Candidatus Liptonbacteria bacterium]
MSTSPWSADEGLEARSPQPPRSYLWRALLGALVALGIGAGVYGYVLFNQPPDAKVSVVFETPPQPLLGEPFLLFLSVANQSDNVLHDAKLSIFLPQDVAFVGEWSGERVHDELLGTLGPGSVMQRTMNVVASGQAKTVREIRAKFVYTITPEGRVQFERNTNATVQIGEPAITLSLETPQQAVNGEPFTVNVKYKNVSTQDFRNVRLGVTRPGIFQFRKASLEPASRANDSWNLGALKAGAEGQIAIEGVVVGPEGSFFTVAASVSADFLGESKELANQSASLTIATSPLSLSVSANGSQEYVAGIGDSLQYVITYRNNSAAVFRGIAVRARLIGGLFDYSTLSSQGSFNSLSNTLTWIAANAPELESLGPGEERTLNFSIRLKPAFPISRASDKNYTLKVEARVESPTVPSGIAAERTVSVASLETKVRGAVALHTKALWRDAAWGFLNEGPYPPRMNQPTQYTIHWSITNYATDIGSVHMETFLQSGAKFLGKAKSTVATLPQYDAATGRVTWDIPTIAATRGVVGAPVEGVFQIEVTPAVTHVGNNVVLTNSTRLQASDLFTGVALESVAPALTTALPEDPTIQVPDRRVQP